ncbi:hypothetical protein [Phaeobacter phage MD18]|nr:hypothetical protein [Phaeobacter phage MD18]
MSWKPIDENTPTDRWILLKGGTTTEDNYVDELTDADMQRPVVGKMSDEWDTWEADASWDICYWDGAWRTTYHNPTHWMEVPE